MRIFVADKTDNKMKQLTQEQLEQVYREHPEWRTEVEVGKWYKVKDHKTLFFVTNIATIVTADGFGFNSLGFWFNDGLWSTSHVVEAKPFEVEAALIAEARKRGFKSGVEINNSALGFRDNWQKIEGGNIDWGGEYLYFGNRGAAIFYNGKWADVREAKPNIEVGKWYKNPMAENLFCPTSEVKDGHVSAFGFTGSGARWWSDDGKYEWCVLDVVEATHEEVEAALIAEAKRRYRDGDKVGRFFARYLEEGNSMVIQRLEDSFMESDGSIWVYSDNDFSICLFKDGKWATVITPASHLTEDIQALKDKYPNYNWTIIAEAKQ